MAAKPNRRELVDAISLAGRESSTATIMLHTAIAERAGLSPTEMKTMDLLARHGALTAGELSVHTGLATPSVTSLIDRLEKKKLVKRVRDRQDRRKVIVQPSASAGGASMFAPIQEAFESLLADFSDDQLRTILAFMHRTTERIHGLTAELSEGRGHFSSQASKPIPPARMSAARKPASAEKP